MDNLSGGTLFGHPLRLFGLAVLSLGLAYPELAAANPPGCGAPPACAPAACCAPCCPPPDVCTCTSYKPVCDTCYHQQCVTTYRDVCRTCYKQEPYCVTVPVQKVNCVTVDEGCYKMVWCPKVVQKAVPYTEYHQQVCSRTVPYTVTQRVPQVITQTVPEYRVRYVPQTQTFIRPACPPPCAPACSAPVAPSCGSPAPHMSQAGPMGMAPQTIASMPAGQFQQPAYAEGPQQTAMPVPVMASQNSVASNSEAVNNSYVRARSAANVWAANRGPVQ